MLLRTLTVAALLVTFLSMGAAAQNANSVVAAASKAMGAGQSEFDHLLGNRAKRGLRPEQEHRGPDGRAST